MTITPTGAGSAIGRTLGSHAVQSGLLLGGTAAALSFAPSLMPRPATDQALVAGGSMLGGFVVGSAATVAARQLAARGPLARHAGLAYAALGAAGAATALVVRPDSEHLSRAALGTAGTLVAAGAASAATAHALRAGSSVLATRLPGPLQRLAGPAAGIVVAGSLLALAGRASAEAGDPATPLASRATTMAAGAGAAAVVGGLLVGLPALGGAGTRRLLGAATGAPRAAQLLGAAATVGLLGAAGVLGTKAVFGSLDAANDTIEPAYATPPTAATVSGGPGSGTDFGSLGRHGRRFVSEATTAQQITDVTGEAAIEPVRVYIGLDAAEGVDERIRLAMAELRRTGAFDRELLVMAAPSGTGFVNPIPIEAAEYMTRGDVATVAVPYGARPSALSHDRIGVGRKVADALHRAVAEEVASMPETDRPRVVVYGESLGAHTSQDPYVHTGTRLLQQRGIDGALWVGTPFRSEWHAQTFRPVRDAAAVDRNIVGEFDGIDDVEALDPKRREQLRYLLLAHDEDPVARFGIDMLVQQPAWMGDERPAAIDTPRRWLPVVSFFQTLIDTKNAATVVPGEFRAAGHDYRADLAEFVREAYDLRHVDDRELARIEQQLVRSEQARSERLSAG